MQNIIKMLLFNGFTFFGMVHEYGEYMSPCSARAGGGITIIPRGIMDCVPGVQDLNHARFSMSPNAHMRHLDKAGWCGRIDI